MAQITPVQRTLAKLKEAGFMCDIVERWLPNPKLPSGGLKKDFLNIIDLIAISPIEGIIGYQVCGTDFAAHYRKIVDEYNTESQAWLKAGGKLVIISWRKVKRVRGGKLMVWRPRIVPILMEHLVEVNNESS